jgi:hypothetical protein
MQSKAFLWCVTTFMFGWFAVDLYRYTNNVYQKSNYVVSFQPFFIRPGEKPTAGETFLAVIKSDSKPSEESLREKIEADLRKWHAPNLELIKDIEVITIHVMIKDINKVSEARYEDFRKNKWVIELE